MSSEGLLRRLVDLVEGRSIPRLNGKCSWRIGLCHQDLGTFRGRLLPTAVLLQTLQFLRVAHAAQQIAIVAGRVEPLAYPRVLGDVVGDFCGNFLDKRLKQQDFIVLH